MSFKDLLDRSSVGRGLRQQEFGRWLARRRAEFGVSESDAASWSGLGLYRLLEIEEVGDATGAELAALERAYSVAPRSLSSGSPPPSAEEFVGPVWCSCGATSEPVSDDGMLLLVESGWRREPMPQPRAPAFVRWTCPSCVERGAP